jgi:hypothetical protein
MSQSLVQDRFKNFKQPHRRLHASAFRGTARELLVSSEVDIGDFGLADILTALALEMLRCSSKYLRG